MTTTYEISNRQLTSSKPASKILVRLLYDGTLLTHRYNPERFGDTLGDGLTRRIDRTRSLTRHDQSWSQLKRSAMRHSPGTGESRGLATSHGRDVTLAPACKTRSRRQQSIPRPTAPVQIRRELRDSDVSLSRSNATARSQVRALHLPSHEEIHMSDKCFACGKRLGSKAMTVVTSDGQKPRVGSECFRKIDKSGTDGWQPPKGGPKLFLLCHRDPAALMLKHPAGLTTMTADERRAFGRTQDDAGRKQIAQQLEQVRMIKQNATPKSEVWYVADLHITAYCDALYAGRTIDPLAMLDAAEKSEVERDQCTVCKDTGVVKKYAHASSGFTRPCPYCKAGAK